MNSDIVSDYGVHQSSPRLEYKWCDSSMQGGRAAHLTWATCSGWRRACAVPGTAALTLVTADRTLNFLTTKWFTANGTLESASQSLTDGLGCSTEKFLGLLLVRSDDQIQRMI